MWVRCPTWDRRRWSWRPDRWLTRCHRQPYALDPDRRRVFSSCAPGRVGDRGDVRAAHSPIQCEGSSLGSSSIPRPVPWEGRGFRGSRTPDPPPRSVHSVTGDRRSHRGMGRALAAVPDEQCQRADFVVRERLGDVDGEERARVVPGVVVRGRGASVAVNGDHRCAGTDAEVGRAVAVEKPTRCEGQVGRGRYS